MEQQTRVQTDIFQLKEQDKRLLISEKFPADNTNHWEESSDQLPQLFERYWLRVKMVVQTTFWVIGIWNWMDDAPTSMWIEDGGKGLLIMLINFAWHY